MNRDQKVVGARLARRQHCLNYNALERALVGRNRHLVRIARGEHWFQVCRDFIDRDRHLVDKDLAVAGDGERGRLLLDEILRAALRQIDLDRIQALHRERGEHEGHEQEEHHVDHRNDLYPAVAEFAGMSDFHRRASMRSRRAPSTATAGKRALIPANPPSWSSRIWSARREPSRSIVSSARACVRENRLNANSAINAINRPSAVEISASATPAVTWVGATRLEPPMTRNASIMPVIVPSSPIS